MKRLGKSLINLFFPNICFCCSVKIEDGDSLLCPECNKIIAVGGELLCNKCGMVSEWYYCNMEGAKPVKHFIRNGCERCLQESFIFDKCRSVMPFNASSRALIHNLKYFEKTRIARYLANLAVDYLEKEKPFHSVDFVVPVPLHLGKLRERGFNQSDYLAKIIAKQMEWKYTPKLVKRVVFTKSQTFLTPSERKKNVGNAFAVDEKTDIYDKSVLVVDDVFTTGATVNAIASVLKKRKVKNVFVLTIARA